MHTIFKRISLVFSWSEGGSDTSPFTAVWHRWTGRNYLPFICSQGYFLSPPQNFSFTSLLWIHWYQLLQRYIKLVSEKFDKMRNFSCKFLNREELNRLESVMVERSISVNYDSPRRTQKQLTSLVYKINLIRWAF